MTPIVSSVSYARVPQDDKERYLADVNLRPDEADIEAYEAVPVEAFGAAALRGMGWKEGEAIGSTNKVSAMCSV